MIDALTKFAQKIVPYFSMSYGLLVALDEFKGQFRLFLDDIP
jgi:hypothetical protein